MENNKINDVLQEALDSLKKLLTTNEKSDKGIFWDDAFQHEIPLTIADGLLVFFELEKVLDTGMWEYDQLKETIHKGTMQLAEEIIANNNESTENGFRATYFLSKENIKNKNVKWNEIFSFSYGLILSALSAAIKMKKMDFSEHELFKIGRC